MDNNSNSNHWVREMVSEPYFVFNFLAFFSYIPIRCSIASHLLSPHLSSHLLLREIQAFLAFAVFTIVKVVHMLVLVVYRRNYCQELSMIVREETWEVFIAETLFFAKIFLVGVTLVVDYHLALWYVLVFLVIYILTPQPAYQGLGSASQLTPLQLEALLTEGNTSRFWLVEFRALSSARCVWNSRHFPELSITYSNKNLSFGIVDLGLFSNTAENFGISLGGIDRLPTYIMFENAVEVKRWPEVDSEVKGSNLQLSKGPVEADALVYGKHFRNEL